MAVPATPHHAMTKDSAAKDAKGKEDAKDVAPVKKAEPVLQQMSPLAGACRFMGGSWPSCTDACLRFTPQCFTVTLPLLTRLPRQRTGAW